MFDIAEMKIRKIRKQKDIRKSGQNQKISEKSEDLASLVQI